MHYNKNKVIICVTTNYLHAAYYSMCILCIYNLCKQDVVYVEAQYPLDNYCSHYKAMSMLLTKMDSA